jgi:hypothetical protein
VQAATLTGNLPASQIQGTLSLTQLPGGILTNNQTGVSLSGAFTGDGSGLTNVSATTIGGLGTNGFWQIAGNAGTTAGPNFIGTVDNQPLEIRVNNTRAFRLEPTSVPSVEGGYSQNSTHGFTSAAIVGGGTSGSINEVFGDYGFIGAGHGAKVGTFSAVVDGAYNDANSQFSFVGAGIRNTNRGDYSFIGGGTNNWIQTGAILSVIGGGRQNIVHPINGAYMVIGGGYSNLVSGTANTVGGGYGNIASNSISTVGGGEQNVAGGIGSTVAGGFTNISTGYMAFIGGGQQNICSNNFTTIGGGLLNIVSGINATVAGGTQNLSTNGGAAVVGGAQNLAGGFQASVGGGYNNQATGQNSVIAGGANNISDGNAVVVSGGSENHSTGDHSNIAGGQGNATSGAYGAIGGGANNIASGIGSFVGGGGSDGVSTLGNVASGPASVIGGGLSNTNSGYTSVVGGGYGNVASGASATVGGGANNVASGDGSTVAGGYSQNTASGSDSTIGGGGGNTASGYGATIGGGVNNQATNLYATVPGGVLNYAYGYYSFAAGQQAQALNAGSFVWADSQNAPFTSTGSDQFCVRAQGGAQFSTNTSLFFGSQTRQMLNLWSTHYGIGVQSFTTYFRSDGGFSWFIGGSHNDAQNNPGTGGLEFMRVGSGGARILGVNNWDVTGTEGDFRVGNDSMRFKIGVATNGGGAGDVWMRAHGGTGRIFMKTPGGTTIYSNEGQTAGVSLAAGGTAWAVVSDRNAKKDFAPIDSREILEKLAAIPITQWHYKWEEESVTPHIGPMAQDFKAAFYPGTDDKSITTQEADGVAFAAIQGLNQKMEDGNRKSENGIQNLQQKLEQKETEITELKQRLAKLEQLMNEKIGGAR